MKIGSKGPASARPLREAPAHHTSPATTAIQSGWTPKARRTAPATTLRPQAAAAPKPAAPKSPLWVPPTTGQWTVDAHGVRSDPVNIYAHGSLEQLKAALSKAGWTEAAQNNKQNNAAFVEAVPVHEAVVAANALLDGVEGAWDKLTGQHVNHDIADPTTQTIASMPVSRQTLDGQPNLASFEMNNNPLGGRDHLRIFDTGKVDAQGQHVWAIAASRDTGIKLDPNRPEQGFLNHAVEANTDGERNTVVKTLESTSLLRQVRELKLAYGTQAAPATGAMPADQQAYDLVLKP